MNGFWLRVSSLLLLLCIAGCGGGGDSVGTGNTVFINASLKDGASGAIFAHMSSNGQFTVNDTAFTIKSTPYSTTGTIPNSDVQINKISYTFTPVPPAPAFTPSVPSMTYSGLLEPGGSLDIENVPILYPADLVNIAGICVAPATQCQYNVVVTFSGVEVNTGETLTTEAPITAIYFR